MKNFIYISLIAIAFTACSSADSGNKKAELEKLKKESATLRDKIMKLEAEIASSGKGDVQSTQVSITSVQPQPFRHFIEVQAKVEGDENISVSPQVPGTITRVNVQAGQHVSKGTVLAEIDNATYVKGLDELQSGRDFANTIYQKQKALWDQKIGTEIQYLTAKNNLENLDKKIATVREQIDMTRIKSPIDGTVDEVDFKVGQAVAPGMPGMRVVNFSNLKVKAEVAESYISKVKKGDDVVIEFPDLGKSINTKLTYSSKVINQLNRTFTVEIAVNPKDIELHPNMIAVVRIVDYKADNAIVLPVNTVQVNSEGSYVLLATGTKEKAQAKKQNVQTGKNYNGMTEIVSGLKPGDPVITSGFQNIVDGQNVSF